MEITDERHKKVQSLGGFTNFFYRIFTYKFSKLAVPLTNLTHQGATCKCTAVEEDHLDCLKAEFVKE